MQAVTQLKEARNARQAQDYCCRSKIAAAGDTSVAVPLSPEWDIALLEKFENADFAAMEAMKKMKSVVTVVVAVKKFVSWIAAFATFTKSVSTK